MRRLAFLATLGMLLLLAALGTGWADGVCEITQITVEPLPNAVRIRLAADGLLNMSLTGEYWQYVSEGEYWDLMPLKRITFLLNNVRAGAAPLVEIGQYPVSHLEFTMPKNADEGVGILCALVLYKPAKLTMFEGSWDDSGWRNDRPQVLIERSRQKNEIIITVMSDRLLNVATPRPVAEAPPRLAVAGTADRLTVDVVNTEMQRLVNALSFQTGVPIALDDAVQRKVTAHLSGTTVPRVLQALANGYGLTLAEEGGIYYLHRAKPDSGGSYRNGTTRTMTLHYLTPDNAQALLPDAVLSLARPNPDTNTLTLSGPAPLLDKIARDIRLLDQPAYHTRLRAWIISSEGADERLREIMARVAGGTTAVEGDTTGRLSFSLGPPQAEELLAQMRALAVQETVHIQAVPSIIVENGQRAQLFVGQQIYYWRLVGSSNQEMTLAPIDSGTRLDVQTRTGGEWITAGLLVESSFLRGVNTLGPMIVRQRVSGTLRLQSGDTIVVGGLCLQTREEQRGQTRPLGRLLSGKRQVMNTREAWVLLQAETGLAARDVQGKTTETKP